MIEEMMNDPT